jgi:hypothetical protein
VLEDAPARSQRFEHAEIVDAAFDPPVRCRACKKPAWR